MPLDDVLWWLRRRGKRGIVSAQGVDVTRTFRIEGARITSVGSSSEDEHLGCLLVDQGLLSADDMARAYAVQAETQVKLGKILIMIDAIDAGTLRRALEDKIIDAVADVLSWPTGEFEFAPGVTGGGGSEVSVDIEVDECLHRARDRATRWRRLRPMVPTLDTHFWVVAADKAREADVIDADRLVGAVEDGLSVRDIARRVRKPRLPVVESLARLVAVGAIAVERRLRDRRVTDSPPSLEELGEAARGRAAGGDVLGGLEIAHMANTMYPTQENGQALVSEMEVRTGHRLAVELLSRVRVPELQVALDGLDVLGLSDDELAIAQSVDGCYDLWTLVERSPLGRLSTLIAFKKLLARDIVSV